MKLALFAEVYPNKGSVQLARELYDASEMTGSQSLVMMEMLFAMKYSKSSPAILEIKDGYDIGRLAKICREAPIIIEVID